MAVKLAARPRHLPGSLLSGIALAGMLSLACLVYLPGLSGGFYLDDFAQILYNPYLQNLRMEWQAFLDLATTSHSGPTGRPVAMLSFAADRLADGLDPRAMKAVNVGLHLVNGLLIYLLLKRLLPLFPETARTPTIAALVLTGLWLFHPLHVSTVLYVVQRMTLLSALFMLMGLIGYCHWRIRRRPNPTLALASLITATLIATLAKENGVLALAYAALIEVLILRFHGLGSKERRLLQTLFLGLPVVGLIVLAGYWLLIDPDWFTRTYAHRNFDVVQRLLTEARALAFYQKLILIPNLSQMGLYHDDYPLSTGFLTPPTTLLALLWHLFLTGVAWKWRLRLPFFGFSIAWFYASHLLESTIIPLEPVFEHRNYLAVLGIYGAVYSLLVPLAKRFYDNNAEGLLNGMTAGLIALFILTTVIRTTDWGDFYGHALMETKRHPDSARSQFEAAQTLARGINRNPKLIPGYYKKARHLYLKAAQLEPNGLAPLVSLLNLDHAIRRSIDEQVMEEIIYRLRYLKPIASTGLNLHRFLKQILEDDLKTFNETQILAAMNAALANPHFSPHLKAEVLVAKALFFKGQKRPLSQSIALLTEASRLMPKRQDYRVLLHAFQIDAEKVTSP